MFFEIPGLKESVSIPFKAPLTLPNNYQALGLQKCLSLGENPY